MNPCLAIIDSNTLSSIALRSILWDVYNNVEVYTYGNMDSFIRDSNRHFVHFFVNSDILFKHIDEFETLKNQTTVISVGPDKKFSKAGFNVLDISLPEEELMSKLLRIQLVSRYEVQHGKSSRLKSNSELSAREKDVLRLMVKGMINKEMAETLGISATTVIFHRNNICEKLQTRSIGKLTIFAVLSGIIDINEI
jgi:DNA-binding CsgD family transcriptional regulator